MGDHDGRGAVGAEDLQHLLPHAGAGVGVQVAEGFVHEHEAGPADQAAGDGHPLLLTTGKLVGLPVGQVGKAYGLQFGRDTLPSLGLGQVSQSEAHVAGHGEVGEERQSLEYHAYGALLGRQETLPVAQYITSEHDAPGGRSLQTGDAAQQGAFSAAAGTHHHQQFAGLQVKVHPPQHGSLAIRKGETVNVEKGGHDDPAKLRQPAGRVMT